MGTLAVEDAADELGRAPAVPTTSQPTTTSTPDVINAGAKTKSSPWPGGSTLTRWLPGEASSGSPPITVT